MCEPSLIVIGVPEEQTAQVPAASILHSKLVPVPEKDKVTDVALKGELGTAVLMVVCKGGVAKFTMMETEDPTLPTKSMARTSKVLAPAATVSYLLGETQAVKSESPVNLHS